MPTDLHVSGQDLVVVQHRWKDTKTGQGVNATITWTPIGLDGTETPNLVYGQGHQWFKTRAWTTKADPISGYVAVPFPPSNDPDYTTYVGVKVAPEGETALTVAVPHDTPVVTVTDEMREALASLKPPVKLAADAQVRAVWLTDLVQTVPTGPISLFWTAQQTYDAIVDGVDAHDTDPDAHADIRALIGQGGSGGSTPDATTSTKGKAVLLGGTADAPTVPWSKVTGAPAPPTSLPPSGGAGGVLSGTYPNPGFAIDMASQAELNVALDLIADLAGRVAALEDGTPTSPSSAFASSSFGTTAFGGSP